MAYELNIITIINVSNRSHAKWHKCKVNTHRKMTIHWDQYAHQCQYEVIITSDDTPRNSMFGTITFSQMPVSVLVSANSCLYAGRSATDARN